jgi:6-phosphogluconolactonase (cycloisomerase 2 family)
MRTPLTTLFLFVLTFSLYANSLNRPIPNGTKDYKAVETAELEKLTAAAPLLFVSSNTQALIGMFDVSDADNIMMNTFPSAAEDADGIYYHRTNDVLFQLNRTDNKINSYTDVCTDPTLSARSTSGVRNGREISVIGNKLVAAQDAGNANGMTNKLVVYTIFPSTNVSFDKTFVVDINLWGIHAEVNTLYAVVDNSNKVAVFNDFFNQKSGLLEADMTVEIEGLVRTHGITYDAEMDMMLLTDIGDAGSATDGALVMINNWMSASADGMISMSEQVRVDGPDSELGNPVDIAFDKTGNRIYVAERANGGGKVLGFAMPLMAGPVTPVYSQLFAGASAVHFSGAGDMPDACELDVDGGMVSLSGGGTETTIVIDGNADLLSFESTSSPTVPGASFTYVVTDADGMILGIPPGNMVDFDPAGLGACLVYGLSYTGELRIEMGDDLLAGDPLSSKCFELSSNYITVNRVADLPLAGQLFVSSNTQPVIGVYDVRDDASIVPGTIPSVAGDADGIYYDRTNDVLYQLNRTDNVINAYSNVSTSPVLTATSTSDFTNGREIAVTGNRLVVTQDAGDANGQQNRLLVYIISPTSITFEKAFDVDINLWGIHADYTTLYAVVDNSDQIAVFNDFFTQSGASLTADMIVSVEGLVRTHGISYDAGMDIMYLTDVGDAASATDGALVVVPSWTDASADGMIGMDEQGRAAGAASQLGNPVDIAYDNERRRVYVAERAQDGGKVLAFKMPILTGGIAPVFSQSFAGASAIFFSDVDDMPDACALVVDGGTVSLEDGATKRWIVIDGEADMLTFASVSEPVLSGASFTYVVTDADGMVLGIPPGNMVDFDPAGLGACLVYGLSYTGNLQLEMGDDLFSGDPLSDGCFELSSNWITVNRVADQDAFGQVYFSSNTSMKIGMFEILQDNSPIYGTFDGVAADADGIYYDAENDVLYQLNRTDNVINLYGDVSTAPMLIATSTSDFTNGREIAVSGDKLVVAQDASDANGQQNRLVVYTITPSSITFEAAFDVDINLWGLVAGGDDLFAIVDNSDQVAVFEGFFQSPMGSSLTPDVTVTVENMVRTHGIDYDAAGDIMLLTDIGDAASATDGALVMISNWTMASADGMISMSEQGRVSGGASQLGNPVDIALDLTNLRAYVAERANGGGKMLVFKLPFVSGGIAPVYSQPFAGASAVHFSKAAMPSGFVNTGTEQESLLNAGLSLDAEAKLDVKLTVTKIYPVPAIDLLNVNLNSSVEQEVTIGIFNVAGTLLTQKRIDLQIGENLTSFDVSDWPSGMYFIRIPGLNTTTRFVKAGKL